MVHNLSERSESSSRVKKLSSSRHRPESTVVYLRSSALQFHNALTCLGAVPGFEPKRLAY